ncbi:MAG: Tol-Pal system beta propeller repeat protein TolB [Gammaproteobacteria bacterium]|nr:Tol-Pal system beta propeller repeat protein TolB [Gammaproteobacteria bacterium]
MRKILLSVLLYLVHLQVVAAPLTIQITEGAQGALPIAVVPFAWQGGGQGPGQDISEIIRADLARSGLFNPMPVQDMLARPKDGKDVSFKDWRVLKMENLVVGQVQSNGSSGYLVRFQLFDVFKQEQLAGYNVPSSERDLRATAHHIADIIYEKITGKRGAFSTKVAYVTSINKGGGKQSVVLQVADADGFNPQTIVTSSEPLMSPSWSPDGRKLAYVSFEGRKASIYVQGVYTGKRQKVASYRGINGAPSWSPDGNKLALTLSKDGNPDIYVLNLQRRSLQRLTKHYGIDTEPAWSPDGKHVVFTSARGGQPQIYRVPAFGGKVQRVTFKGKYNARASYSPDGKYMAMVNRNGGAFRVALLDLKTKAMRILSDGRLDESPSFAPNGSMVIYATKVRGKGELAAVSIDGNIKQRLALQAGDVREPAWSPYSQSNQRN